MSGTAMSLKGKRIVVVGGATGIGFAIAEVAHEQGASVVLGSSNQSNVQAASERLQGATGYAVDLREESSVKGFFKQVGPFDHLAITAGDWGGPMFVSIQDLDLAKAHELLTVRFWGALAAVKHGSHTIAKDGSITLTSGMIGHRPRKGTPVMAAVGGAVEHLTVGLAMDLAPVRVNAVNPGYVLTEQLRRMPDAMLQSVVAPLPIRAPPLLRRPLKHMSTSCLTAMRRVRCCLSMVEVCWYKDDASRWPLPKDKHLCGKGSATSDRRSVVRAFDRALPVAT